MEFEIYKRRYPMPARYRLGDPVLVREVTGMEWPEFIESLNQMEANGEVDQVAMLGVMAVAFWQGNPDMTRDKVRRVLERVWQEDAELIADDAEADAGPPDSGSPPDGPPTSSNDSPDADSDTTNQNGSTSLGSPTGSPESSPA